MTSPLLPFFPWIPFCQGNARGYRLPCQDGITQDGIESLRLKEPFFPGRFGWKRNQIKLRGEGAKRDRILRLKQKSLRTRGIFSESNFTFRADWISKQKNNKTTHHKYLRSKCPRPIALSWIISSLECLGSLQEKIKGIARATLRI